MRNCGEFRAVCLAFGVDNHTLLYSPSYARTVYKHRDSSKYRFEVQIKYRWYHWTQGLRVKTLNRKYQDAADKPRSCSHLCANCDSITISHSKRAWLLFSVDPFTFTGTPVSCSHYRARREP